MQLPRFFAWMLPLGTIVLGTGVLSAQTYPNRPIRMVTSEAGGSVDALARVIAQGILGGLGQNVIIDNRGAIKSGELVSRAPPDGYTLLVAAGSLWVAPLLQKTPYDAVRDFSPITTATSQPYILVVYPGLPVKTVKELIAYAKARPGELNYASSLAGSGIHLATELFKSMAGVNIVRIPYKGMGLAIADLIAGQVQMSFPGVGGITPHIKSGKLRALAITSAEPSPLFPDLPTVAASGLPGYAPVGMTSVFAPANTPDAIITRLNQELVRFLKTPEASQKFSALAVTAVGNSPQQLAAVRASEVTRIGKLIRDVGIKAD